MSKKLKNHSRFSIDITDLQKFRLSKIEEVPKEKEEDLYSYKKPQTITCTPKSRKKSLPPILSNSSKNQFLVSFFLTLSTRPKIYKLLTSEAQKRKILKKPAPFLVVPIALKSELAQSLIFPETSISASLTEEEIVRPLLIDNKQIDSIKRQSSKESLTSVPALPKPLNMKMPVLDKNSVKLFDNFKAIAGGTDTNHRDYKLNYDSYKEFLSLRYPAEMLETMLKWLYHGLSVNFEGWVQDMQKFVNMSQEKHAKLAFELYDFNKDKYICTADAFRLISLENSIIFNQDIVKFRSAFVKKTSNEFQSTRISAKKNRRKSIISAEDEVKVKVPNINPSKPEALTFEDFLKINFHLSRPQVIVDLIKYLTQVDLYELNQEILKPLKRKKSEDIIEEMILNNEYRDKIANDSRISYYKELENAMGNFSLNNAKILLLKFNEMSVDGPSNLKEINLKTVSEFFPKYFGNDNEYIMKSFHNFLTGPKNMNITKVSFLNSIKSLMSEENSNIFAFSIYDQNKDGLISCEELNRFFESLNEKSLIYKECMILVNEYVASIFGKRHKPLDGINYQMFKELIPKSILIEEFIKSLFYQDSTPRRNLTFSDIKELTVSDLECLKKYPNLARPIELGDLNRRSEEELVV